MPRPDVHDERKPQILDAAARVFAREGLADARMEDIAREAQLSVGGVYWYYKSKDEVVHDLIARLIDPDVAGLRALLNEEGTVQARLAQSMGAWAAQIQAMLPLTCEFYSLANRDARVRLHIRSYLRAYQHILGQLIQQGIESGEFRPLNVDAAAALLAALYEGMLELRMIDPEQFDVTTRLDQAFELLMQGMRADAGRGTPVAQADNWKGSKRESHAKYH